MLLFFPDGTEPLQRIGFFAGSTWLLLIVLLAQVTAVAGSIQLLREIRSRHAPGRWRLACRFGVVAHRFRAALDRHRTLVARHRCPAHAIPGKGVSGGLLAVCGRGAYHRGPGCGGIDPATPNWSWRRWAGVASSYVIFSACALTFHYWGLLGFAGW